MRCRLCKWLCDRFCRPEHKNNDFWRVVDEWEADHLNAHERALWEQDGQAVHAAYQCALDLYDNEPAEYFLRIKALSDQGSVFAMRNTAFCYRYGVGVKRDLQLARSYYGKAVSGGSQLAMLALADFLYRNQISEEWQTLLEQGVEDEVIPAIFWLSYRRAKGASRRALRTEIRPLMERAAHAGHPGARLILAQWKMLGRLGIREVRDGYRAKVQVMHDFFENRLLPPRAGGARAAPS